MVRKKLKKLGVVVNYKAFLVSYFYGFLFYEIDRKKYYIFTNESGLNIDKLSNIANDIAIYDKDKVVLENKYFSAAPKVALAVDIKIDLSLTKWINE